jgi:Ca-activated chloride channel homolog
MQWNAAAVETQRSGGPEAFILVTAEAAGDEARAPVMVNLLLDRSGSMKGAPLAAAIEAAMQFVDLARNDDYLGLLLFDGVVEQRVPVCPMDARGKKLMAEALQDVHTGRGTALFSAIDQGAKALSRVLVPGRKPRLLLLTDGEPSVGWAWRATTWPRCWRRSPCPRATPSSTSTAPRASPRPWARW